jgi:hypothetical protein
MFTLYVKLNLSLIKNTFDSFSPLSLIRYKFYSQHVINTLPLPREQQANSGDRRKKKQQRRRKAIYGNNPMEEEFNLLDTATTNSIPREKIDIF